MPIHGKQHPDCQRKPINYGRDINAQQEREKKRQAVVFVSSFHPRGGVSCCSWRDGAGFFFPMRDGVAFFFFSTGRDGAMFCFFFEGRDGTGRCFFFFSRAGTGRLFLAVAIFLGGTGQNRYTVPSKAV